MGMMMRRRRPIARMAVGAAVAGTAYHAGKANAQQDQINDQAQDAYAATQAQQYAPPPPAAPYTSEPTAAPVVDEQTAQLQNLAQLHTSGVLTDEEFSAAKAKLLGI